MHVEKRILMKVQTAAVNLKRVMLVILLWVGVSVCAYSQHNPYAVNDTAYAIYVRAYQQRSNKQGLAIADTLLRWAKEHNDHQAELMALSIPVFHYFSQKHQFEFYNKVLKEMATKAAAYGRQNYYYFCVSNKIAYLNNEKQYLEALQYANKQLDFARQNNHQTGISLCTRMIGVVHETRGEYMLAIQRYREAIDYAAKHAPSLDRSNNYLSICNCYRLMCDYQSMLDVAEEGLSKAPNKYARYNLGQQACYALFMLHRDKEFRARYDSVKTQKPETFTGVQIVHDGLAIAQMMDDGQADSALDAINAIRLTYGHERRMLLSDYYTRMGDDERALQYVYELFNVSQETREMCRVADEQSAQRIYGNMELQNERQQVEYRNNQLQLENTNLQLHNSSIELSHTQDATRLARANAERSSLSYRNQQLVAQQLKDSLANQQLLQRKEQRRLEMQHDVMGIVFSVVTLIIIMTLFHIYYSRRTSRKLKLSNEQLKRNIGELDVARERAQEAERMKTQFIQNMSHELRTPLNAISGFSQVLVEMGDTLSEEEKHNANKLIEDNAGLLTTLVDDILDLTTLESTGSYAIKKSLVMLNEMCRETIETVRHRKAPDVELVFKTDYNNDYSVVTDAQRVRQVLINMLTNAEKNTTHGSITLHCSCTQNIGMITFIVIDTGIGVPREKMKEIFQRFKKLDNHKQGTGLGLDICRTIAHKLGGQIDIDPHYTDGARFWFTIPVTQ